MRGVVERCGPMVGRAGVSGDTTPSFARKFDAPGVSPMDLRGVSCSDLVGALNITGPSSVIVATSLAGRCGSDGDIFF